jgi:hypothetical protein
VAYFDSSATYLVDAAAHLATSAAYQGNNENKTNLELELGLSLPKIEKCIINRKLTHIFLFL